MEQKRVRIPDRKAAKRAGVTPRTLRRWENDKAVGYPSAVIVRGRRYRWLDQIEDWERLNPGFGPAREQEEVSI
jgi:hypothetical protein